MNEITEERNQLIFNFNEFLPHGLNPYDRLVLIKFICLFGTEKTNDSIILLSEKIGVQHKKLRQVLEELLSYGILDFTYPESGRRSKVRTIKLNLNFLDLELSKRNNHETLQDRYSRLKKAIKQFDFLSLVFLKLSQIKVTTKNKESQEWQGLDFRVLLTLLHLSRSSDAYGVIRDVGTTGLTAKTGLNKHAVFDSIHFLKNIGLLRVHVHGTINNKFIKKITPIYVLNLSHEFWENNTKYGQFFIIKNCEKHHFEVKNIAYIFAKIRERVQQLDPNLWVDMDRISGLILNDLDLSDIRLTIGAVSERAKPSHDRQEVIFNFLKECLIHYLQLQKCHQAQGELAVFAKEFKQASVNQKKQHIKLNDLDSNLAMMQCYLESWCSRLFDQQRVRKDIMQGLRLYGVDILSRSAIEKDLHPFTLADAYRLEIIKNTHHDNDFQSKIQKIERQEQLIIKEFLLFCLNLIAKKQIYPFLKSTHNRIHLAGKPFQIMPREERQEMYSCIYVPSYTSNKDEFFLIDIHGSDGKRGREHNFLDFYLESIEPDDKDLKSYGLLDNSFIENN